MKEIEYLKNSLDILDYQYKAAEQVLSSLRIHIDTCRYALEQLENKVNEANNGSE